jgi:hypothetical protein
MVTIDAAIAALHHLNGFVNPSNPETLHFLPLTPDLRSGLSQILHLHLLNLRWDPPRPRRPHLLRPLHKHGRLQELRDPPHGERRQ